MSKTIFLCAISNIASGQCGEDCAFCTQSARHRADIPRYSHKPIETIVDEARRAKAAGAIGFCLVTAGKGIDDAKLDYITRAAHAVRKVVGEDFNLIACNGLATVEQLRELKKAGVTTYNHNLEAAKSHYPSLVSTHSWEARLATIHAAREAGLMVCSGGIFGTGESEEQREEFIQQLADLKPDACPINFFHPNPSLPIQAQELSIDEAITLLKMVRRALPTTRLMVAGGRQRIFGKAPHRVFEADIDAIVIGDYLTTRGSEPERDRAMIEELGYTIATSCRH
ncbi:MAG: biotin synthase [Campylobacterales bacterium]